MPPGSILGESDDSYVYNDGSGNVAVVPKSTLDPSSGIVGVWNASKPQPPAPDVAPQPAAPAPPPMATLPQSRGTGVASAAPMPVPTPAAVNASLPPQPAPVQAPQKPMTPEQLQNTALQQGTQALDAEAAATTANGKLEAENAAAKEQVLAKRNQDIALQQQAADAQLIEDQKQKQTIKQQIAKATDAEDNFKVDQNRFYHDMSTGKTVGMYVMAAIAGLGQVLDHKDPTKNPVLAMMDAENAKDVNAQLDQRDQLGKRTARLKGDLAAATTDSSDRQAQFYKKMAVLSEGAARQIEQAAAHIGVPEAQNNAAMAAAGMRLKKAEYIEKAGDKQWTQDFQKKQADRQDMRAGQANAIAGGHLALARQTFDWTKQKDAADLALRAGELEAKGKGEQAKQVREFGLGGSVETVTDEKGQPVIDENTGLPKTRHGMLVQEDGSPFLAANTESRNKLVNQKAATDTIINVLDQIRSLRKEKGWSSDLVKSDEWQEMKAHWGKIVLTEAVANQLGAISKDDRELISNLFATNDPSGMRDPLVGLDTARKDALLSLNNQLRAENYTGKDYDIPDAAKYAAPASTEADKRQNLIMSKTSASGPSGGADISASVNPVQKQAVQLVKNLAVNGKTPREREDALKQLQNAADNAPDEGIRQAASAALAEVGLYSGSAGTSSRTSAEAPDRATAKYTPSKGR